MLFRSEMPSGEIRSEILTAYPDQLQNVAENKPFYNGGVWNKSTHINIPGGQNYWDFEAPRDVTGNISRLNDLKAFDIERASGAQRRQLADATEEWLRGYGVTNQAELNALRNRIEYPGAGHELPNFKASFWDMQEMIQDAGHPNPGDVRGEWFDMVKDKLGIEAFPHRSEEHTSELQSH